MIGGNKERLFGFVDRDKLPTDLNGTMEFNSRDWIRARYKVEGFTLGQVEEDNKGPSTVQARILAALSSEV